MDDSDYYKYQVVKVSPGGSLERSCQPKRSGWPKGKFSFFAPHRLSVQKVQTTSITQNSGQVPTTSNYNHHPMFVSHVAVSEQRKSLYNESARPVCLTTNFRFLLPTASQCKMLKQVLLRKIVFRCPHHL